MTDFKIPDSLFDDLGASRVLDDMARAMADATEKVLLRFVNENDDLPDDVEIAVVTEFVDGQVVVRVGVPEVEVGPGKMVYVVSLGALRRAVAIRDRGAANGGGQSRDAHPRQRSGRRSCGRRPGSMPEATPRTGPAPPPFFSCAPI